MHLGVAPHTESDRAQANFTSKPGKKEKLTNKDASADVKANTEGMSVKKSRKRTVEAIEDPTENGKSKKSSKKVRRTETAQDGTTSATENAVQQVATVELENGEEGADTTSFLKGFESSGEEDAPKGEQHAESQSIPGLPKDKALQDKLKKLGAKEGDGPGVVYVG